MEGAPLLRCVWGRGGRPETPQPSLSHVLGVREEHLVCPVGRGWCQSQPARGWSTGCPASLAGCGPGADAVSVDSPPATAATQVGKLRLVREKRALGAGAPTATASLSQAAAMTPHSPSRRMWTSLSPSSPASTSCVWSGTRWTLCRYAAWGCAPSLGASRGSWGGGVVGLGGPLEGRVLSTLVLSPEVLDFSPWLPPIPWRSHAPPLPRVHSLLAALAPALRPWCWSPGLHPHGHPAPLSEASCLWGHGRPASLRPPLPPH